MCKKYNSSYIIYTCICLCIYHNFVTFVFVLGSLISACVLQLAILACWIMLIQKQKCSVILIPCSVYPVFLFSIPPANTDAPTPIPCRGVEFWLERHGQVNSPLRYCILTRSCVHPIYPQLYIFHFQRLIFHLSPHLHCIILLLILSSPLLRSFKV